MILLIDNEDSFVHNLARYFVRMGQETMTVRHNRMTLSDVGKLNPAVIILSPGPGTPGEKCLAVQVVREYRKSIPMLGVCLGHQQIGFALGARIVPAVEPVHGRVSQIQHDDKAEFSGHTNPFRATRYHSLVIDESSLPAELQVSARTADGTIMGVRSIEGTIIGWQFHPESILTPDGLSLVRSFLVACGLSVNDHDVISELAIRETKT